MSNEIIEDIASKHLGKAGDGTRVDPYKTPDMITPDLLVGVPRVLNRTQYEIDEEDLPFVGLDSWNCYEFSCLLDNGFPVSGLLRINYSSDSKCIVESKSLKLYLNSFNMHKTSKTVEGAIKFVQDRVEHDLLDILGTLSVDITLHLNEGDVKAPVHDQYIKLEDTVDVELVEFTRYNEDPDILEVIDSTGITKLSSSVLRSNCRVTNQPDWGDVFVYIEGDKTITPESLLQYIVSMRKENHFHEEVCECIYKRLHDLLQPEGLIVTCVYTRRGGIDINPLRASSDELVNQQAISLSENITRKTMRQ